MEISEEVISRWATQPLRNAALCTYIVTITCQFLKFQLNQNDYNSRSRWEILTTNHSLREVGKHNTFMLHYRLRKLERCLYSGITSSLPTAHNVWMLNYIYRFSLKPQGHTKIRQVGFILIVKPTWCEITSCKVTWYSIQCSHSRRKHLFCPSWPKHVTYAFWFWTHTKTHFLQTFEAAQNHITRYLMWYWWAADRQLN